MELQTDQATPEYSAAEGEKRAFNKFYANLLANHGVSRTRQTPSRARGAKLSCVNLNFAPTQLRLFPGAAGARGLRANRLLVYGKLLGCVPLVGMVRAASGCLCVC